MVRMPRFGAAVARPHCQQLERHRTLDVDGCDPLEPRVVRPIERNRVVAEREDRQSFVRVAPHPHHREPRQKRPALLANDALRGALGDDGDIGMQLVDERPQLSMNCHVGVPHHDSRRRFLRTSHSNVGLVGRVGQCGCSIRARSVRAGLVGIAGVVLISIAFLNAVQYRLRYSEETWMRPLACCICAASRDGSPARTHEVRPAQIDGRHEPALTRGDVSSGAVQRRLLEERRTQRAGGCPRTTG